MSYFLHFILYLDIGRVSLFIVVFNIFYSPFFIYYASKRIFVVETWEWYMDICTVIFKIYYWKHLAFVQVGENWDLHHSRNLSDEEPNVFLRHLLLLESVQFWTSVHRGLLNLDSSASISYKCFSSFITLWRYARLYFAWIDQFCIGW